MHNKYNDFLYCLLIFFNLIQHLLDLFQEFNQSTYKNVQLILLAINFPDQTDQVYKIDKQQQQCKIHIRVLDIQKIFKCFANSQIRFIKFNKMILLAQFIYLFIIIMEFIEYNCIVPQHQLNPIYETHQNLQQLPGRVPLIVRKSKNVQQATLSFDESDTGTILLQKVRLSKDMPSVLTRFTLHNWYVIACKNQYQKTLLLRRILKINEGKDGLSWGVDPSSGQIFIKSHHVLDRNGFSNSTFYRQALHQIIIHEKYDLLEEFKKITLILGYQLKAKDQQLQGKREILKPYNLQDLKRYVNHSGYYTWSCQTANKNAFEYSELKANFLKRKKIFNALNYSNGDTLKKVYQDQIPTINQMKQIGLEEDNHIKLQFIMRFQYALRPILVNQSTNSNNLAANTLGIRPVQFQALKTHHSMRIQTNEDSHEIRIHRYFQSNPILIKHERTIIKCFPRVEHPAIPKYFILRSPQLQHEIQKYFFTDAVKSTTYLNYLQSNKKTISIFTKLCLMNQIIMVVKYLKDNQFIYNNLTPENVYVRPGLFVKLVNYSNCYHEKLVANQDLPFVDRLPYVINLKLKDGFKSYMDQRADSFSMSCLVYKTLFGKDTINIKESKIRKMKKDDFIIKILERVIAIQNYRSSGNTFAKLIMGMCLMGHNFRRGELTQTTLNKDRPFLQWHLVVNKFCQFYLESLC